MVILSQLHIHTSITNIKYRYSEGNVYQRDNARTQLFGSVNAADDESAPVSPYASSTRLDYSQATLAQLESQSEEQMGAMGKRIQALKSLSVRMGDEIRGSNQNINNLNDTFESTTKKLKNTFANMMEMAGSSRISIKTWLLIFGIVFLIFFWVWIT